MKKNKNKEKIKKIYYNSFPESERFSFWLLLRSLKSNNVIFDEIKNNNQTIGMKYVIVNEDTAYLMYFAIDKIQRNNGYGSRVLKELTKQYNTVILSIEKDDDNKFSQRRKEFYLRNGFYETHKYTEQNNIIYELLCSNKKYVLTKEKLIFIYKKITNSKILGYFINKQFKLFDVNFIDES